MDSRRFPCFEIATDRLLGRQALPQSVGICFENKWSVPCEVLEDAPR
jgi:hypothetical protein